MPNMAEIGIGVWNFSQNNVDMNSVSRKQSCQNSMRQIQPHFQRFRNAIRALTLV